ncbi:hypothetical protein DL93DRAFT_2187652 [Clavulina sp. PMI_390]|nr:hypothetical protein DL93DRAFT_2187652 [Clavulina sp. PMI_390]
MPSIYALAILLARFASPASLFTLSQIFHYDVPTLSRCVNMMSKLIYERWHHLLDFDPARLPPSKLDLYANAFANKGCPSNRIWGAIDCTIIPISRPGRKQQVSYNGYKKQHATKYQGVTTPDGLIALCFGPVAGRRSDGTLLRLSDLKSVLTQHARGMDGKRRLLYGDPAYTPYNGTWLMAGFKKVRKLTPLEESFNKEMSRYRQCAEWSFGKLANIFPFFDFKKRHRLRLSPVGRWFLVGVLLTNAHTCLYLSETSRFFGIYPPSLSEYFK